MAINEIIRQIDIYLELLHQARKLLSGEGERKLSIKTARPRTDARANSKGLALLSGQTAIKTDSRFRKPGPGRRSLKKRDLTSVQVKAPLPDMLSSGKTAGTNSDQSSSSGVVVKRLPPQRRVNANRPAVQRGKEPGKQDSVKPTALSNPVGPKIVVLSAEQARLERERLATPTVVRPRLSGSGATGRSAFEALFSQ